jgi:hypothetical protein
MDQRRSPLTLMIGVDDFVDLYFVDVEVDDRALWARNFPPLPSRGRRSGHPRPGAGHSRVMDMLAA